MGDGSVLEGVLAGVAIVCAIVGSLGFLVSGVAVLRVRDAVSRVNALGEKSGKRRGTVLGIDLQEVEPIAGAEIHQLDFLEDGADEKVKGWLGGRADVVMSDMAAAASGHKGTDHLRIVALIEAAPGIDPARDIFGQMECEPVNRLAQAG